MKYYDLIYYKYSDLGISQTKMYKVYMRKAHTWIGNILKSSINYPANINKQTFDFVGKNKLPQIVTAVLKENTMT